MNPRWKILPAAALPLAILGLVCLIGAADPPPLTGVRQPNGEVLLQFPAPAGAHYRLDVSDSPNTWTPMSTLRSTGSIQHTDTAAPFHQRRFYRAVELTGTSILTGDHLVTSAGEIIIHPVNHASFILSSSGKTIYNDPVGATSLYASFPPPDLILVSHAHGDHFSNATLEGQRLRNPGVIILAPPTVRDAMTNQNLRDRTTAMSNGSVQNVVGVTVEAIPMYNFDDDPHPQGRWNGYVLTIGDTRLYMSGDTEDTPEMRALLDIDVAFICMSLPSNMTEAQAASAVRAFRPKIVYPYHYRESNLNAFKAMVGSDLQIEVRIRTWY